MGRRATKRKVAFVEEEEVKEEQPLAKSTPSKPPRRSVPKKTLEAPVPFPPPPPPSPPHSPPAKTPKTHTATTSSTPPSSPKKGGEGRVVKPALGQKLFMRREEDVLSDMAFIVPLGEEEVEDEVSEVSSSGRRTKRFMAHRIIVREGSKTLEDMICRRAVSQADRVHLPEIRVPSGVGPKPFEIFLKNLYTEEITASVGDVREDHQTLISLLVLADYFDMAELYNRCSEVLKKRVNVDNCTHLFEMCLSMSKSQLCEIAFDTILKNLPRLLKEKHYMDWNWKIWRFLLPRLSGDELVAAFKALKLWRDDELGKRQETFQRLGKCVRYRTFGSTAAADTLEGAGVLSQNEMVSLFMYFAGGQRMITVSPKEDLQNTLDSCPVDSRVRLSAGVYTGDFTLCKKGCKLIGEGNETVINGRLVVDCDECEVTDLKIVALVSQSPAKAKAENTSAIVVSPGSGNPAVVIKGNGNSVTNVTISKPSLRKNSVHSSTGSLTKSRGRGSKVSSEETGPGSDCDCESAIVCMGNDNKFANVFSEISTLTIHGDSNRLECLHFQQCTNGIVVNGDSNTVSDVLFEPAGAEVGSKGTEESNGDVFGAAVRIPKGGRNLVSNISFVQIPHNNHTYMLSLGSDSVSTKVRNCGSGAVEIGGNQHEIIGVNLSPRFKFIVTGQKHQLVDCSAEQFQAKNAQVTITNCEFY